MRPALAIFDLDGTLIEDHLIDEVCEACDGEGVAEPGAGMSDPCPMCNGRRTRLVPRSDRHYTSVVPLDGALERIRQLRDADCAFAIATNQGGVALGFQKPGEVHARIANTLVAFDFFYSAALSIHWCLDHPNATVEKFKNPSHAQRWRRKPNPGMLEEAMRSHGIPPEATIFVGDRKTDEEAAGLAEVAFLDAREWLAHGLAGFLPS